MNTGVFVLGAILTIFGFFSDMANYYEQYSLYLIILGIILLIVGAFLPSITTSTERREVIVPESRKTKTVIKEE